MFANFKALEGVGPVRGPGSDGGFPACPIGPTVSPSFPSFHGRHSSKRKVNTAYSLSSFRPQMIQRISQFYSHHSSLGDKLRVINLAWCFM